MKSAQLSLPYMLILLAGLTALGPLAIDAYLPAIPTMAGSFHTSIHNIELSLSLFLAGFSAGQLMGGPTSDHFGRRFTVLTGLFIFSIGTIGIIFSDSLISLLAFRIVQAFGGGVAVVNSSAIIRDISSGKDNARNLSHMVVIMMLAPLCAPLIGNFIFQLSNWHGIFVFLLLYALLIALLIYKNIHETRVKHSHKVSALQRYLLVLKHRKAVGYILASCFSTGAMFAFVTGSPSVYMGYFGISESIFPLFFGLNVVGIIAANRLNVVFLNKFEPHQLLSLGQAIQLLAGTTLLVYIMSSSAPVFTIIVVLILSFIGAQGFIVANATSSTIEFFPHNSGTASALFGACGFGTGALTGSLVGLFGDGTPLPMAIVIFSCIVLGISLRFILQRN